MKSSFNKIIYSTEIIYYLAVMFCLKKNIFLLLYIVQQSLFVW